VTDPNERRPEIEEDFGEARLFTLEEAREMMPALREALRELQAEKREFDELRRRMRALTPAMRANGHALEAAELEERIQIQVLVIRAGLTEIEEAGVLVKDLDLGLVDFPSLREGRVVFLCWMISEPDISYWHEITDGFQGRRPL